METLSGEEDAPKITGMLIDLPSEDLTNVVNSYMAFSAKIMEAKGLLNQK